MKRLLALLLLLPLAAWGTDKINIAVPALLTGDAAISRQPLTLTPTSPLPRTYYTNVFSRQPISRATDANGLVTFSNIVWGYYRLDIPGNPGTSFGLVVGTNLTGTVNVVTLITNTAGVPPNPSTNYLTEAQSDARYATIGSGGGGGGTTYTNNSTGLPGVIVGSGIGTNFGNIHVASATDADFATEATRAHGLLDLDSVDALTTTLTKIVATSGHDYLGGGSGLTNIPSLWVASIAALTNLPNVADGVVGYVDSYFGTNVWGGGAFKRSTGSSATIDNGTVFAASGSGRWLRVDTGYPTNVFLMEWFGVVPNAAINQYTGIQAAMNATPSTAGACITPPYGIATATTLTWTNRRGCYFGALGSYKTATPGYRVYPNPLSVIHWMGVNGGTNLVAYDVGHCTFAGFGLDTRIGLNDGSQYTNAAGLLMDVDMNSTHTTTTTANVFDGMYFRERHTNTTLVGLRIAYSNWQNCEFFQFYDCSWQGSGADIPEYWISTTNVGGAKAIQLGGGGGGQNSFNHQMRNCGFNTWQYFIYSAGGGWDITENYGTAAGVAAYYLNGDNPSYIRSTRDEGDRQFVVSPSTKPVTLVANHIAMTTGMSLPNITPVDAVNLIALGNDFQHEANVPSITNSVNSTGWYFGSQNSFDTTNDAQIASWRFNSSFKSFGDFGTLNANNNIQSGPWKTPSSSQTTNLVYQSFTDSATFPTMTLMPSNGAVAIGGAINNSIFGVWNADPLNRTSLQVGDQYENPRTRIVPGANTTTFEITANTGTYLRVQSSNAIVDVVSGNANNTLNFRSGYGQITGTNDIQLMRFDVDGQIWFPYASNLNIGSSRIGMTSAAITNHLSIYTNNALASLSATPMRYGQIALANSNATLVAVAATTSGSLAWGSTNVLPTTAAQVVNKFTGTPTGSLFLRDDGTLAAPSVGGVAWGAISGTLSSQTDLQTALDAKAALAEANQFTKTNAFDALRVTNLLQGASTAIVGWNATSKLLTTQSVSVAGSQITLGGTDGKLLFNNAGGVDYAEWSALNNQGGTLTTNNNTLLGGSFVLTGDGARGVTNLSVGAGLTVENGVLKTNGQTTGGGGSGISPTNTSRIGQYPRATSESTLKWAASELQDDSIELIEPTFANGVASLPPSAISSSGSFTALAAGVSTPYAVIQNTAATAYTSTYLAIQANNVSPGLNSWALFRICLTNLTSVKHWFGAQTTSVANHPENQNGARHYAAFRFSTNSANWFLVTGNGTNIEEGDTGIAATTSDVTLEIEIRAAAGACSAVVGYINGVPVKTNSTYLPSATMLLSMTTYTTENVAKGYRFYKYFRRQSLAP